MYRSKMDLRLFDKLVFLIIVFILLSPTYVGKDGVGQSSQDAQQNTWDLADHDSVNETSDYTLLQRESGYKPDREFINEEELKSTINDNNGSIGGKSSSGNDLSVSVTLTIGDPSGSQSEIWKIVVGDVQLVAPGYGEVVTETFEFNRGQSYEIQVIWLATKLPEGPDHDYIALVDVSPGDGIVHDPENLLGTHYNDNPPPNQNYAAGKTATLELLFVNSEANNGINIDIPKNKVVFKTDDDPNGNLDEYLYGPTANVPPEKKGPIEFDIFMYVNKEALINPELVLCVFDVDQAGGGECGPEVDKVYINNHYVGELTGTNNQWSIVNFSLPTGWLYGNGDTYESFHYGRNEIRVDIDTTGTGCWGVQIAYGIIQAEQIPIVFVPGLEGTYLLQKNNANEVVWPNLWKSTMYLTDEYFFATELQEDGITPKDPNNTIKIGDLIDDVGAGSYKIYGPWHGFFRLRGYFTEKTIQQHILLLGGYFFGSVLTITDLPARNIRMFELPYDWRLSFSDTAIKLATLIEEVKNKTGSEKIILIGHCAGGLICRKYLTSGGDSNVDMFISLTTPYYGATKLFQVLQGLRNPDFPGMDKSTVKRVTANFSSIYQLLPTYEFWNQYGWVIKISKISEPLSHMKLSLEDTYFTNSHTKLPNQGLVTQAIDFHESMGDGFGNVPKIYFIIANQKSWFGKERSNTVTQGVTSEFYPPGIWWEWFESAGDQTVPLRSQEARGLSGNIIRKYFNCEHMEIVTDERVHYYIWKLIKEQVADHRSEKREDHTLVVNSYVDHGIDIDADNIFDYLAIDLDVTVSTPGLYEIIGWLNTTGENSSFVSMASNESNLTTGHHVMTLYFRGDEIYQDQFNGSYVLGHMQLYDGEDQNAIIENAYTTGYYEYLEFDDDLVVPREVTVLSITDAGIDINDNGLYDYLNITLELDVSAPGEYEFYCWINTSDGSPVALTANSSEIPEGMHTINISFRGWDIFQSKMNGPYNLSFISRGDVNSEFQEFFDVHTTNVYSYSDFEQPPALFTRSFSYKKQGNFLYIDTGINVTKQGLYSLAGRLAKDDMTIASNENSSEFDEGIEQTFSLIFNINDILPSGRGPYILKSIELYGYDEQDNILLLDSRRDALIIDAIADVFVDDDAPSEWYDESHENTIQEGINNASAGSTIFVYNGNYEENVVINKAVNLIGQDKNTTIIDGNDEGDVIYISLYANGVNITGFTVQNSKNEYTDRDAGIHIRSKNNIISRNIIVDNGYGIYLDDKTSYNILSENTIHNNYKGIRVKAWYNGNSCENNTISGNSISGNTEGIAFIIFEEGASCKNNIISGNTVVENHGNGIMLMPCVGGLCEDNIIRDNMVLGNDGTGILLYTTEPNSDPRTICKNNTISRNNVSGNSLNGIELWTDYYNICQDNIICYNNIQNNGETGITIYSTYAGISRNNTINGNSLMENGGNGIYLSSFGYLSSCNGNSINENMISGNNGSGINLSSDGYEASCENNIIKQNSIINNKEKGIEIYANSTPYTSSNNNIIYHNNFINNNQNAYDECSNIWYNEIYKKGNYWDDFIENPGYPEVYEIPPDGNNNDIYPLLNPWSFHQLVIYNEIPVNGSDNVDIWQEMVGAIIEYPNGDLFNWTIEGEYIVNTGADGDSDGVKLAMLMTPLPYKTDIIWYMNATDGTAWTNYTFQFKTIGAINPDIYVDDDAPNDPGPRDPTISDPLEDGSIEHPFDSIQEGIDNAITSDTVFVYPGIYYENVVIEKSINLIGHNQFDTIINAHRSGDVIEILADNTTINGFKIINGSNNGIKICSNYSIISKNNISDNRGCGIESRFNGDGDHNIISKNIIMNNGLTGIWLDWSDYNTIKENSIMNHCVIGMIIAYPADNNIIYHNNFINNNQNAYDENSNSGNIWYNEMYKKGNYWDDFIENPGYPEVYEIPPGNNNDIYPLIEPYQSILTIRSSNPANEAIDARKPHDPNNANNKYGWTSVEITLDGDVSGLTPADFSTSELGGDGSAPTVISVTPISADTVTVNLSDMIEPGAWTVITHIDSGTSVHFGYLPGDVDGSGTSNTNDIIALIDSLNGITPLPDYSTNIDRSNTSNANDIIELIDLLNGLGEYEPWMMVSLPPYP